MNVKSLHRICAALLACLMAAGTPALLPVNTARTNGIIYAADEEETGYTEVTEGSLTYHNTAYAAEVVSCDPKAESVKIPAEIEGLPVMSIGDEAFKGCALSSVTIPDSVEVIGDRAFASCVNLKKAEIPSSVMHLGASAFQGCTSLTEVTLQEGLTSIDSEAFADSGLKKITIPSTVSAFGKCIFDETPYWEALTAEEPLVVFNEILIDGRSAKGKVIIPDGVATIVKYAFEGNKSMTTLTIPESVQTIGMDAFADCKNLTEVSLPEGLVEMEIGIFSGCSKLASVTIPDSITVIRSGVFAECSALKEVNFPDHQIDIYSKSFDNTPWLAAMQEKNPLVIVNGTLLDGQACKGDVTIPDDVTIIASRAFDYNPDITSVTVPAGVAEIWDNTFNECTGLETVTLKGAKYISNGAFCNCSSLKKVIFAGKLTGVDENAFQGIQNTLSVTFFGSITQWEQVEIGKGNSALEHAIVRLTLAGDATGDGKFAVNDVIALQKWLLAVPKARLKNPDAADMDLDGTADVYDLAMMKRALLKA